MLDKILNNILINKLRQIEGLITVILIILLFCVTNNILYYITLFSIIIWVLILLMVSMFATHPPYHRQISANHQQNLM